eukprot:CAMPEP_0182462960 /NCGR_PEP_ID=MMETSP1319-20130603/7053_1 /TAXON_ID=172717 /ORGANISM="Bolidomonas pacifica, Strain RCC208" /LENGTH=140 /DNA_ID=CAMNT_0024662451 /DNA_START=149 /DNA_END=571 /DNA_ORIENTATION=+
MPVGVPGLVFLTDIWVSSRMLINLNPFAIDVEYSSRLRRVCRRRTASLHPQKRQPLAAGIIKLPALGEILGQGGPRRVGRTQLGHGILAGGRRGETTNAAAETPEETDEGGGVRARCGNRRHLEGTLEIKAECEGGVGEE